MESFKNFFHRIYLETPEEHKVLGGWGDTIFHTVFEEGLIHSYDINKVYELLKTLPQYHSVYNQSNDSFSLIVDIEDRDVKSFVDDLNKRLSVYGYFVGKVNGRILDQGVSLAIEMKHPDKLAPEQYNDGKFYHITHGSYVDKISKKGLSPRSTTTLFSHPGGRIYILQLNSDDTYPLESLSDQLFQTKWKELLNKASKSNKVDDVKRAMNFSRSKMAIFEVDLDPSIKLSYDPMVPRNDSLYRGLFTSDYISPARLKLIKH